MPTGLSLHIGLNKVDPRRYDGWDGRLVACENDARDMAALATGVGFGATTLMTPDGTVENITAELRKAAARLKKGDILLFTYSGHGGQIPDAPGPDVEADDFDETLVLYDRQLLDDELYAEFQRFEEGVRIVALLDCCHSGTGIESVREILNPVAMEAQFQTSDPEQIAAAARVMPLLRQTRIYERDKEFFTQLQRDLKSPDGDGRTPTALLISGCQDNQTSADGPVNGAFTEALLDVWSNGSFRGGYRPFHRAIQRKLPATQSPNLFLTGEPDAVFLDQKPFTI
ncbi:caspase family protein [Streptomyces bambusae]|uniref:caspase family protein n=1 Tax=Streptomyces bambusae TaxID=1550616 RepID=UPI001CFDF0CC|nr:caspase family protein [Streptomyces bambusae]MCB5164114.1 caspase family protein [Streptomyces bambusae]